MQIEAPWKKTHLEVKSHYGMVPHWGVDVRVGHAAHNPWVDGALLALRVGTGALMAGHGAQKLFGWFGGHGLKGTGMWLESMGLKPGHVWAGAAAAGEMGGGLLTALGLGGALGPIGVASAMGMATAKAHWGKPIWATEGGAELPVIYTTAATAVALAGPGRFSLDYVFGIKLPWWVTATAALLAGATVAYGATRQPAPQASEEEAVQEAPAGGEHAEQDTREPVQLDQRRHAARETKRAA